MNKDNGGMRNSRKTFGDFVSVLLLAVLFTVILLLVVFSAVTYQRTVGSQDDNNNARAVRTYVVTAVKDHSGDSIVLEERDGVMVLAIVDEASGYEQQICHMDGKVLETYGKRGTVPDPESALVIGETDQFEMRWRGDDLLEIRTGYGTSYVAVRPEDGGRPAGN